MGSLRIVTDSSGAVVKRIDYDTFGNILSDSNPPFAVPFGFAGGLHDRDTGLVRFGFRDYMPEIGRWTAKDPILFAAGDTNLYGYVGNDPVNFVDPAGLEVREVTSNERQALQGAINKISRNKNWAHVGRQLNKLAKTGGFAVETDFSGSYTGGVVKPLDMINRQIRLNPDLLDYNNNKNWNECELIETIIHEFVHYNQFSSLPVISQILGGWANGIEALASLIAGKQILLPAIFSLESGAYSVEKKARRDVTGR